MALPRIRWTASIVAGIGALLCGCGGGGSGSPPVNPAPIYSTPAPPPPSSGGGSQSLFSPGNTNACVTSFYDPNYYNWLSFGDSCSQDITLIWVFKNNAGGGYQAHILPGGKANTGFSAADISNNGGLAYYACPGTAEPVNADGTAVNRYITTYWCRP